MGCSSPGAKTDMERKNGLLTTDVSDECILGTCLQGVQVVGSLLIGLHVWRMCVHVCDLQNLKQECQHSNSRSKHTKG